MDLSSLNASLNVLCNKITKYLDNVPQIGQANYEQQQDIKYISDNYNNIVFIYSELLNLITETQYFISQCKKVCKMLSNNTSLEKQQKEKIKAAIEVIEEQSKPLYNERERLKTLEMFYRSIYTRRDF